MCFMDLLDSLHSYLPVIVSEVSEKNICTLFSLELHNEVTLVPSATGPPKLLSERLDPTFWLMKLKIVINGII